IRHPLGERVDPPWRPEYAEYGVCINSGKYDGLDYPQAVAAIAADLNAKALGEKQVQWRLRDWGISRQRYWGCPIPIVHCPSCGDVPVPDDQLPVKLPEHLVPDGTGNPLAKMPEFYETKCPSCGRHARREWVNPADVTVERDAKGKIVSAKRTADGVPVVYDGIGTMSKSKNNGVDPQALIDQYGADTARFYTMFASPPTNTLEWSDESVEGSYRFLRRVWDFSYKFSRAKCAASMERKLRFEIHSELRKANDDIERQKFNTVASACMKILNALEALPEWDETSREGLSILIRLLSPIA